MYDTILVPTDGTDAVEPAVEHALGLAETSGATIHALYVVDRGTYAMVDVRSDVIIESLEAEGEQGTARVRERAEEVGVPVVTEIVRGDPYREIVAYANDHDVDLIVMGTHGRRGVDRFLLGSVTEKVIRSADQPVLTVRSDSERN